MLTLISATKLVAEVALLSLAGRWVLGLLAGPGRRHNLFYQVLFQVGEPFVRLARRFSPGFVLDRHLPLVAFLLLALLWLAATLAKISHCLSIGVQLCR
jgi:uncharacterized protein YggT (Ycf19 family)